LEGISASELTRFGFLNFFISSNEFYKLSSILILLQGIASVRSSSLHHVAVSADTGTTAGFVLAKASIRVCLGSCLQGRLGSILVLSLA
jgi:hypothetical protein